MFSLRRYGFADAQCCAHSTGVIGSRQREGDFRIQQVRNRFIRTSNENSLLTLEAPEKRESESSRPIFRNAGCNPEGCVRETEISLQTESAAVWANQTRKA
jgi:hypothetical protein